MKATKLVLTSGLFIISFFLQAQDKVFYKNVKDTDIFQMQVAGKDEPKEMTLNEAIKKFGSKNEYVSFGISLGLNQSLESLKAAQISPLNQKLIISDLQQTSFVLSSVVSVPLSFYKNKFFQNTDKDGNGVGKVNRIAKYSLIAILNLATFSEAQTGSIFNQQISGGFGFSYNINKDVAIGMSFELINYRKPKDFVLDKADETLLVNNEALTTLDISNNTYFKDHFASTLSLKLIYKLTTD